MYRTISKINIIMDLVHKALSHDTPYKARLHDPPYSTSWSSTNFCLILITVSEVLPSESEQDSAYSAQYDQEASSHDEPHRARKNEIGYAQIIGKMGLWKNTKNYKHKNNFKKINKIT